MNSPNSIQYFEPMMPWFFRSFWRLVTVMLGVLLIPFGLLLILLLGEVNHTLKQEAINRNKIAARLAAKVAEEHFEGLKRYVESYSRRPILKTVLTGQDTTGWVSIFMREFVESNVNFHRVVVTDANGKLILEYPFDLRELNKNYSQSDWFKGVKEKGGTYISKFYKRGIENDPHIIAVATPILIDDSIAGYMAGKNLLRDPLTWLSEIEPTSLTRALLIDHQGNIFLQIPNGTETVMNVDSIPSLQAIPKSAGGHLFDKDPLTGEESLLTYKHIYDSDYSILMIQPLRVVLAPVRVLKMVIVVLVIACIIILMIPGVYWFNSLRQYHFKNVQMTQHINSLNQELQKNIQQLSEVNETLDQRVKTRTKEIAVINKQLKTKNEELVRTNEDLDNFVYSASHDLKAPVINLELLFQMLFSPEVDEKTKNDLIQRIQYSLQKVKNTITALSEAAKAQKKVFEDIEEISFDKLMDEISMDIGAIISSVNATIIRDFHVINIRYSKSALKSILYNLVSNAIKYADPQRKPEIKVSTQQNGDAIVLTVEDNGLGIDLQKQSKKIFSIFGRAHDHVEGTGIGLYVIKKIVENKGGEVKVESEVGRGSKFHVYLRA